MKTSGILSMILCMEWIGPTVSFTSSPFALYIHSQRTCAAQQNSAVPRHVPTGCSTWLIPRGTRMLPPAARSSARRVRVAQMCSAPTLPSEWQQYTDEATGNAYYYNSITGVTQWAPPEAITASVTVSAPAAPAYGSPSPAQPSGSAQRITVTDNYMDIEECSKFFVETFFEKGTTTLERRPLKDAQRRAVQQEALRDLQDRYGQLLGERKLKSALLVMRDEAGAIEACCGIELAVADTQAAETLPRTEGEQMLKAGLAALGGRARNELRNQPVQVVAARVLPQGYALIPVLSNLAVRETSRGQGLGKLLCDRSAVTARAWGFSEMMLLVEEANVPAYKLYQAVGFSKVWTRPMPAARVLGEEQQGSSLAMEKVPTIAMAKSI